MEMNAERTFTLKEAKSILASTFPSPSALADALSYYIMNKILKSSQAPRASSKFSMQCGPTLSFNAADCLCHAGCACLQPSSNRLYRIAQVCSRPLHPGLCKCTP